MYILLVIIAFKEDKRKDKSVIEKYTVFYAFTKTDKGWKMYAISSVILV